MRKWRNIAVLLLPPMLDGCKGWQSALDPQGPAARHLANLYWAFFGICLVVWLLVTGALIVALIRRRASRSDPLHRELESELRSGRIIAAATGVTALILVLFTGLSYATQKRLYTPREAAITIKLTGHQWWWNIQYEDEHPSRTFTTANEMHIPVGTTIRLKLESSDVIHSFWVPNLTGKQDLIPGRQNVLAIAADAPGVHRGQCAEFCGWQHANMSLLVIAEPPDAFERWREVQISARKPPEDDVRKRGEAVFLSSSCVMCHAIRGTDAGSRVGPDLTHLASRKTLAAGMLPLTKGHLAGWIVDPQSIKPGSRMPRPDLRGEDVNPLVAYLSGLQ